MPKKDYRETTIVNVRLPDDILEWIDTQVQQSIYDSRAEAIRDYLRNYIKA